MKTTAILLIPLAALVLARPAMAQAPAETILPAIIPASQTTVKPAGTSTAPGTTGPAKTKGVVINPTPAKGSFNPPHATVFSENSGPARDLSVTYYRPVGAVSPKSGILTYPGTTAAHITSGATRAGSGMPLGSTRARLAGSNGSRATLPSTKARTVGTR